VKAVGCFTYVGFILGSRMTRWTASSLISASFNENCRSTCWNFCGENRLLLYPRYAVDIVARHVRLAGVIRRLNRARRELKRDPNVRACMDEALTPVRGDDMDVLEMFSVTAAARTATVKAKRDAARVAARV